MRRRVAVAVDIGALGGMGVERVREVWRSCSMRAQVGLVGRKVVEVDWDWSRISLRSCALFVYADA